MLSEEIREELDVSRLVHALHVSECNPNAKVGSDRTEGLVYVINVLRLGVQARVISTGVVDTIGAICLKYSAQNWISSSASSMPSNQGRRLSAQ